MKSILPLLLLCGCAPHYYGVKPFYGNFEFDRPVNGATETGVMFELGWSPQQRSHEKRMESYALASLTANPRVNREWLQGAAEEAADDEAEEEHLPFMPDVPENEDERWNILAYGAVALMLAGAVWIFKRATAKPEE